jgi:hypothetical protein
VGSQTTDRAPAIALTETERELIRARLELAPQEMDVVEALLADPLLHDRRITREVIAELLGIERSSVKTNIERMYRDIGVHDLVGLLVLVVMELLQLRHGTNEQNIPAAPED